MRLQRLSGTLNVLTANTETHLLITLVNALIEIKYDLMMTMIMWIV